MIDETALKVALRSRLTGDTTLMTLVEGVFNLDIPSTVRWAKPVLEFGIQADTEDGTYGTRGQDLRVRLMAHARGGAPGVGSSDAAIAALVRADVVLTATPLPVTGQTVWRLWRIGGIPEASPVDEQGHRRYQVGSVYECRIVEG